MCPFFPLNMQAPYSSQRMVPSGMLQGDQALGQHSYCRQYPLAIQSVILDTVIQPPRGRRSGRVRDHFQVDCVNNTELSFCSWPEISRLTKQKRNFSKPGCLTHPAGCWVMHSSLIPNGLTQDGLHTKRTRVGEENAEVPTQLHICFQKNYYRL